MSSIRAIKLGSITFDNPLFIKEEFDLKNVKGISFDTLNGGKIIYESVKRNNANYITLISKESGWISRDTLEKIVTILDDLDVEIDLEFIGGSVIKVRPAVEKGEVIKVEDVVNDNAGWYKVEISLCQV